MIVRYQNYEDKYDAINGRTFDQRGALWELLHRRKNQRPHAAALTGDNGYEITFGISTDRCAVQFARADGSPPYLMAVSPCPSMKRGYVEFYCGGTPTPFAARYAISFPELEEIALHFLETGEKSEAVSWQVLSPRAGKEDAERAADS